MRDRLPPGRSLHRPAGIRLRAWQPGAFPAGPGPLSPAATGPRPGSIRAAPQRAAPMAAATAKNHTMSHLLRDVRAAANAVNMRRYCTGLWSLPASVQGGSDSRITRSARTLVQNWTLSSWPADRRLARPFGLAGRLEPRAGRASHYPDGGTRRRQLPIRGYGHILNLDSPRGCHEIAPTLTAVHTIRMRGAFPAPCVVTPCGHDVAQAHRTSPMTILRRPRKPDHRSEVEWVSGGASRLAEDRLPMTSVPKALPSTTAASNGLSHRQAATATASAGGRGPGLPRRRVPRIRAGRGG